MFSQLVRKFYNPLLAIGAASAATQGILGTVQAIAGGARAKRLQQMLEAYETPDEIYKILDATKNLASIGYDPATLSYLTSNVDQAFASSASIAKRLGADPNTLSALFNERIKGVMKIGAENQALNMEHFSKYLSGLETVAANKAAEQKSKQDLIKDQLQSAAADKAAGFKNISGAFNTALSMVSGQQTGNLFTEGAQPDLAGMTGTVIGNTPIPSSFPNTPNPTVTARTMAAPSFQQSGLSQDLINLILQQLMFKKM